MIVFSGGTIRTMDPAAPLAEALAVDGDAIAAVGDLRSVRAVAGPEAAEHDLAGATLLPGFIDPHHHLYLVASVAHTRAFDEPVRDLAELLVRVEELAAGEPGSGWLRLHGVRPLDIAECRLPTAAELDAVCPDRPLHLMAATYHESTVNSAGLDALGWTAATPDPPGGLLERDRHGRPTGVLIEMASFAAEAVSREVDGVAGWVERAVAHSRVLARHGITRIGDMAVPPAGAAQYALAGADLAVTVHRWHVGAAAIGDATIPALDPGHPRAPLGGFKLLADGGERCDLCLNRGQFLRSAATLPGALLRHGRRALALSRRSGVPMRRADGRLHNGIRILDDGQLAASVRAAVDAGMAPAVHAVGNGAVESVLAAVAGIDAPVRLEHAMICDAALAGRIAESGVHVVTQPSFLHDLGAELSMLPLPAPLRLIPLRTMLDAGASLSASSDYPAGTLSPLVGIQAAVTRRVNTGKVVHADEAITVEEAVAAYTRDAAAALGVAGRAGVLTPGAAADLVVLAGDPLTTDPERIGAIQVLGTWSAGVRK